MVSVVASAGVWMVSVLSLVYFWQRLCTGVVRWDGADWWLEQADRCAAGSTARPGRIAVRLDLQRWLLLRWQATDGGAAHWLWADSAADPAHWHVLRCALYSKVPGQAKASETASQPRA